MFPLTFAFFSIMSASDESRTAATSKMESFMIIFNGWKPLTVITKCSILDVAAALDPLLSTRPQKNNSSPTYYQMRSVSLPIQSERGKIGTRKNSVFGHFTQCQSTEFPKPKTNFLPTV